MIVSLFLFIQGKQKKGKKVQLIESEAGSSRVVNRKSGSIIEYGDEEEV